MMTEAPPTTRQIACALRHFDEHSSNTPVDLTGTYGPQSTDLVTLYVRDLLGEVDWQWTSGAAKYALDSERLREHFNLINPADDLRFGDIVVLYGPDTSEVGTVGVFLRYMRWQEIEVFSQTPGAPRKMRFKRESALGGLRYKRNTPALTSALVPAAPAERRATLGAWMMPGGAQDGIQQFGPLSPDDVVAYERTCHRAALDQLVEDFPSNMEKLARGRRALDVSIPAPAQHDGKGRHFREHWMKRLFLWGKR